MSLSHTYIRNVETTSMMELVKNLYVSIGYHSNNDTVKALEANQGALQIVVNGKVVAESRHTSDGILGKMWTITVDDRVAQMLNIAPNKLF